MTSGTVLSLFLFLRELLWRTSALLSQLFQDKSLILNLNFDQISKIVDQCSIIHFTPLSVVSDYACRKGGLLTALTVPDYAYQRNDKNDEYANDECNYRMSNVELTSERGLTI